jgi:preprotein translocase subunit SecD
VARSARSRPARTLLVLLGLIAVLYGVLAAGAHWDKAQWTPKLALDLEGGTEIVLSPQPVQGQKAVDPTAVDESVNIIRQRVNGSGISEAEVTRQGEGAGTKIVVSLPGKPDPATIALVERSAQLQFRAVLVAQAVGAAAQPTPSGTPSPSTSPKASPSAKASPKPSSKSTATVRPSPSASSNGMAVPDVLKHAPSPTPTGAPSSSAKASAPPSASPAASPSAKPTDPSDLNWVDQAIANQFQALDCSKQDTFNTLRSQSPDPKKPYVSCSDDGTEKYILGPAELSGTDVTGATASLETNSQGFTGTTWQVNLTFSGDGGKKFGQVTERLFALKDTDPTRNRFAIVLDNLVISAPSTQAAILTGQAQITGNFTQASATSLANQLKYGALPVSFRVETSQQISATLGTDNLQRGLLAGVIGLGLVVLYSLLQYRALGLVTVASLTIASTITYGLVVLLGWRQGFRLSLPGVAGLIVSIGITADSFIVFFERVRDEVREGRPLQPAVEAAWVRARRTILASDAVSFLAAIVLYVLAIGNVRGFAFTLGLTTLVDVAVVFLFTKPMVTLLARTRFFGGGHKLSGFDAVHLGRAVAYAGRGRVRTGPPQPAAVRGGATIAERRAERERLAAGGGEPEPGDPRLEQTTTTSGRES